MTALDWTIVAVYIAAMIICGYAWGRRYIDAEDYYLGSRRFSWWASGVSVLATQSSAISFISIPAFVAIAEGGGLIFFEYEIAVPVAMLLVAWLLIPQLRAGRYVSIYEYLEARYDSSIRKLIAGVFLVSRGLGAGVAIYATGIVLTVILQWPIHWTIILIGACTVVYDTIGGMRAVVYSDVVQMCVLVVGLLCCIVFASIQAGGIGEVLSTFPAERQMMTDMSLGLGDGADMPLLAFVFGGLFLYMAYYGTDQSQAQRLLATRNERDSQKALILNGYCRLPLITLYVVFGVCLYALLQSDPDLTAAVSNSDPDYLVPQFILTQLPSGLRGVLIAALIAAAMSSIDSALNSLSAVTLRDFIPAGDHASLALGRIVTTFWGITIAAVAFIVDTISDTVIEAVNQIGSAFYGPVLSAFLLGIWSRRISSLGIWCGVLTGVAVNVTLWIGFPNVHWMWWNIFGAGCAAAVAAIVSAAIPHRDSTQLHHHLNHWHASLIGLFVYATVMFAAMLAWPG